VIALQKSRRRILAALVGATVLPFGAVAQQIPVVGFLNSASANDWAANRSAFRDGLNEAGFAEGRNVTVVDRWAEYRPERLPSLAAELVERKVDVIVASGGDNSVAAALAATKTIPIVFTTANDPVRARFVQSLAHPGGNATGVTFVSSALEAKRLEVLHELVPRAVSIAALLGPSNNPLLMT
jgi:putative ABC transport system substrate-binding protein